MNKTAIVLFQIEFEIYSS